MKSDGVSSETKMPVYLVESLTAMREAAEKSEQRRIKPNKASRSRKSEHNASNISNNCAELIWFEVYLRSLILHAKPT